MLFLIGYLYHEYHQQIKYIICHKILIEYNINYNQYNMCMLHLTFKNHFVLTLKFFLTGSLLHLFFIRVK